MDRFTNNITSRTVIGLAIIVFALMMLFDNLGLHFVGKILSHWPVGMIILGCGLLFGPLKIKNKHSSASNLPYFLIGFGLLFFFSQHHFFNFSFSKLILPAILLAVGIHIMRPTRDHKHTSGTIEDQEIDSEIDDDINTELMGLNQSPLSFKEENRIDVFNILGGSEFSTHSKTLSGGNIVCILGGAEINIREADTDQDTIEIDVLAFMGGIEIKIPPHWQVSVKAIPLLGAVTNKTTCLAEKLQVKKKHLVVTGIAIMGGVDIRN